MHCIKILNKHNLCFFFLFIYLFFFFLAERSKSKDRLQHIRLAKHFLVSQSIKHNVSIKCINNCAHTAKIV